MIEVIVRIDVKAPPEATFAFVSEWSNNPKWQLGMKSCTWTSEPPLRLGSTYDQTASFLGRPIISSFEVVEFEPGAKVRIRTTKSSLPLDITRQVAPGPNGGSTITATIRGEPGSLMRIFNPLTKRMVERNVTKDYARLRHLLDEGA